jgi:DNA-binding NarL/FixJ family response regulator
MEARAITPGGSRATRVQTEGVVAAGSGGPTRVVLVEDEPNASERMRLALVAAPSLTIVAAARTVAEGRRDLSAHRPDLLVTDLGLPDGTGIDLIRHVAQQKLPTLCLVNTVFADDQSVFDALEAGALGYLLKDETPEELRRCALELLAGGSPMSPSIARKVLSRFHPEPVAARSPERPHLSGREREVLNLIVKGFKYEEIAGILGVSAATVATHAQHICRKLAVNSRSEAAYEAAQLGLVDLER